jgi:thiamine biosynthesis protein ThiS
VSRGIEIQLNGENRVVEDGLSLQELLRSFDLRPELIVVEHNGEIVRRDRYAGIVVEAGDSLELVHFVGGG